MVWKSITAILQILKNITFVIVMNGGGGGDDTWRDMYKTKYEGVFFVCMFVLSPSSVCISRFIVDCQTSISLIQYLMSHNLR